MKRKSVLALTGLLTISMMLSACGNKNNGTVATDSKKKDEKQEVKKEDKKQNLKEIKNEEIKCTNPEKLPPAANARGNTLVVGGAQPKGEFNPILGGSVDDARVIELVFGQFIKVDDHGLPIPGICEKWEVEKDGKSVTYHIRKGVKFSDGEELTAEDYAFALTAICDPSYDGASSGQEDIVGYKEYNKGDAKEVSGIKVVDKYTVTVSVTKPLAALEQRMSVTPIPKKYYAFEKGKFEDFRAKQEKPIGAGPYIFESFKPGQEAVVVANKNYYDGAPKIEKIVLKKTNAQTNIQELKSGGTDMDSVGAKPENIDMLKAAGFLNMTLYPENAYGWLGFNCKSEFFNDKKVRQALTYGLQRHTLIETYFKGYAQAINQPQSPVSWAYTEGLNEYKYDYDKADKLLTEAGWIKKDDGFRYKDGKKFEFHYPMTTGGKYNAAQTAQLQQDWKKLGINVIVDQMEWTAYTSMLDKRDFSMCGLGWSLDVDPDLSGLFHSKYMKEGGQNYVNYSNPEADKAMDEALSELDQAKRKELMDKCNKIINEDCPYIFTYQAKDMVVTNPRVKNLKVSSFVKWTRDVHKMELETK